MSKPQVKEAEIIEAEDTRIVKRGNGKKHLSLVGKEKPSIEAVLMRAVDQGAPIETLERIAAMIEKANAQAAKQEYLAALARFQEEMPVIKKQKQVKNRDGSKRFDYAPIEDIMPIARPFLAKNDLSVTTGCRVEDDKLIATCFVHHVGGHTEEREFPVPIEASQFMSAPQSYAAASTFAERYATRQALGIVTAGDDNESRLTPKEARKTVAQPQQKPSAQKKADERPQIEPAGDAVETLDEKTIKGLKAAMAHATLGGKEFRARFPKLERMDQIADTPENRKIVLSWIANPAEN